MRVAVTLHGQVQELGAGQAAGHIDLALPEGATVGDLLRDLADRLGGRFREMVAAAGQGLPPRLRIFVNGDLASDPEQVLAAEGVSSPTVTVVIMAPMMGGAQ